MNQSALLHATTLVVTLFGVTTAFAANEAPAASTPATAITAPLQAPMTKEQAIEKALKAHPGQVTKAYEDTKKGKKTWEVKIKGDDGKKWEMYYEIATGELVAEEDD